jgi:hypothetical protein
MSEPHLRGRPIQEDEMRIVSSVLVDDCVTVGRTWRYRFDGPVTREVILQFGTLGRLELYAEFPHPFYRISNPQGLRVKGTEGEQSCLVAFPAKNPDVLRESFEKLAEAA